MKAMLCVGGCNALRRRMQSFAWANAKLCEDGCKALRESWAKLAQKCLSYSGYDKRGKDSPCGALSPQEISIEPFRLSSYLVWVGVKFSNAKEEELLINDASQIGSKKFDFSIE